MKNGQAVNVYQAQISPELATKYLSKNEGNRKLSNRYVDFFYRQMQSGNWELTGDPIKIAKSGRLLDGQHRLHALVKFGKPVEMFVAENLEDKIFSVLDTGKARLASDVLQTRGFERSPSLASTVRLILMYEKGKFKENKNNSPTNTQILKWVESHEEIHEIIQFTLKIYQSFKFTPHSTLALCYYLFSRKNQTKADDFFSQYATGIELKESSPVRLLRERLLRDSINKTKLSRKDKTALFIYAWNIFITGKNQQQLMLQKNYKFPEPI
jgi:hypothetical protein